MKIAIVTDTHWGARNESPVFMKYFERFFDEVFFPYCQKHGISEIFHLGDLVDRRKYINFLTAKSLREHFISPVIENGMHCYMIPGNHDVYYKNTNAVHALNELGLPYKYFTIMNEPTVQGFMNGVNFLFVPWICPENEKRVMEAVEKSNAQYCCAHLELLGHEMYRGNVAEHGMDPNIFGKFNKVLTGHYHTRSIKNNIYYLGSPYEIIWSDYDDPRGFHVFDTETHELTFIENPYKIHCKVHITEESEAEENLKELEGKIIKVIVSKGVSQSTFEKAINSINAVQPSDVQVVDDHLHMDTFDEEEVFEGDTLQILKEFVNSLEVDVDKERLNTFMQELYQEAQLTKV